MRVQHPVYVDTSGPCPVYACTMTVAEHEREQEWQGEMVVFHHDDSTQVTWPIAVSPLTENRTER